MHILETLCSPRRKGVGGRSAVGCLIALSKRGASVLSLSTDEVKETFPLQLQGEGGKPHRPLSDLELSCSPPHPKGLALCLTSAHHSTPCLPHAQLGRH